MGGDRSIAEKIDCTPETLRKWVRQAERGQGRLWQRAPGAAGVRVWEGNVTGTGATKGVPAAGGR